jgi:hypothetical protein
VIFFPGVKEFLQSEGIFLKVEESHHKIKNLLQKWKNFSQIEEISFKFAT